MPVEHAGFFAANAGFDIPAERNASSVLSAEGTFGRVNDAPVRCIEERYSCAQTCTSCAAICRLCAEQCETHAGMHAHCRICAESCRRCMSACEEAGRSMAH
ncbi:hypothetical protein [Bradyrhizobium sp. USDA 4353]